MPDFENISPNTTAFVDSNNDIQDLQDVLESGAVVMTSVMAGAVTPIGTATAPKFENISPWAGKFVNSSDEIVSLIDLLTSGAIQVQITGSGGDAPAAATYITQTDETAQLPNSVPLTSMVEHGYLAVNATTGALVSRPMESATNQILIINPTGVSGPTIFGLPPVLIAPGSLQVSATFNISGAGATVNEITNLPSSTSTTALMTAEAIRSAIAADIVAGHSFRGGYDASVNLYPSTGGSGAAGAILRGDWWYITVAGTLGINPVEVGDQVFAVNDTPGQVDANWLVIIQKVDSVFGRVGAIVATNADYSFSQISGVASATQGGTSFSSYAKGDLIYSSAFNVLSKLPIGSNYEVLTVSAGGVSWEPIAYPAAPVQSVFGRTIFVTAQYGDYQDSQIAPSFVLVTTAAQALSINTKYYTTFAGLSIMTLPVSAVVGSSIKIRAGNSGNTFRVAQNAGQKILFGALLGVSQETTVDVTGYIESTDPNTCVELECVVANTTWIVVSAVNSISGV